MSIDVRGNSVLQKKEIVEVADGKLEGTYLFLFSRGNIFTYPRGGIRRALLSTYPRLREADIRTTGFSSIKISVKERSPYALWCTWEDRGDEEEDNCYFLDRDGYIFAPAPEFTGAVFFTYRGSLADGRGIVGQQFLTKREFQRLDAMRLLLRDSSLINRSIGDPVVMVVRDENDAELHFEESGKLLFARRGDRNALLANVESLFNSDVFEGEDLSLLDYIDLRFGNKVYFKFRE